MIDVAEPTADVEYRRLLTEASERSIRYLAQVKARQVICSADAIKRLATLREPLPERPTPPMEALRILDEVGSPATIASAGGRYFGLVIGGALPVTVAANWIATAWDQNAVFRWTSPIAAALEDVCLEWLGQLFRLPKGFGGALVSGATMASMVALGAARHALLARAGWNVEEQGLFGAPPIKVIVSDEVHATVLKALSLLGLGRSRVVRVSVDAQGRILAGSLPDLDDRSLICIQAGNVNTGSFDPAADICRAARDAGAWVHVEGAFGLWALAAPNRARLADGVPEADSWATDGHKWLNVPYDSGLAFVRHADDLRAAMATSAAYLAEGVPGDREPPDFTPELSRRARAVEIWAALRSLGKDGVADLIERSCRHAAHFADELRARGFEVLNDVVLNQVLVAFGSVETTRATISQLQADGVCWCGGTVWQGRAAMRISVAGWATSDADVDISLAAMDKAAQQAASQDHARPTQSSPTR
jgi:glutamate/tyrosine decarboxylase-like PLP-dependent enzyme